MGAPVWLFAGAKRGRIVTRKFAKIRIVTLKSTKVRTDQGRGYAMLRIVTGEAYFSPALWLPHVGPQWVGFPVRNHRGLDAGRARGDFSGQKNKNHNKSTGAGDTTLL